MTTKENMEVSGYQHQEPQNKQNMRQTEKKARPGLKLLLIAGMCVGFLIPQLILKSLVSERKSTESLAERKVFEKWAGSQMVTGPVIKVYYSEEKDNIKETHAKILLPEQLEVKGDVKTKQLKRGIYDFTVYETALDLTGQFKLPNEFEKMLFTPSWQIRERK